MKNLKSDQIQVPLIKGDEDATQKATEVTIEGLSKLISLVTMHNLKLHAGKGSTVFLKLSFR